MVCITASPGAAGGIRAHAHLQQLFAATLANQVVMPPVAIGGIGGKVTNAMLTDETSLNFALAAVQRLLEMVNCHRAGA